MDGSVPIAAVVIESVSPLTDGQRVSVCRVKDEYADPLEPLSSAEVKGEDVFNTRTFLALSILCLAAFLLIPFFQCVKVLVRGESSNPDIHIQPASPTSGPRAAGKNFEDFVLPPQSPSQGS